MLIRIEDEADVDALERIRQRSGYRSGRETVSMLIREKDAQQSKDPLHKYLKSTLVPREPKRRKVAK